MPVLSLLPILVYFAVGVLLRRVGIAGRDHGGFVFRLIFYVTLPALAFEAIVDMALDTRSALLPMAAFVINSICALAALVFVRWRQVPGPRAGAVVLGAGIANMSFMFPYVLAVFGEQGLANALLFDLGNAIFVATVAYVAALRFGDAGTPRMLASLGRTLRSPIFIAVAAAIAVNLAGIRLPEVVGDVLGPLGRVTLPLILIGLGIVFSTDALKDSLPYATVTLKMGLGFLLGVVLVTILGLEGEVAAVVIASAAAPIGFSSVTLAGVASLDAEQAGAALSLSVLAGLVTTPLLLTFGAGWF
jgi:predicted permease